MPTILDTVDKKCSGYSVYQQRRQQRRNHLQEKQRLRKLFELGKLIEKVGLYDEDVAVIQELLVEVKQRLRCAKAETMAKGENNN